MRPSRGSICNKVNLKQTYASFKNFPPLLFTDDTKVSFSFSSFSLLFFLNKTWVFWLSLPIWRTSQPAKLLPNSWILSPSSQERQFCADRYIGLSYYLYRHRKIYVQTICLDPLIKEIQKNMTNAKRRKLYFW